MTKAADWGAKPQIKQISPENLPHGRLQAKKTEMITMPVHIYSDWVLLQDDIPIKNISILKGIFQILKLSSTRIMKQSLEVLMDTKCHRFKHCFTIQF